MSEKGSISIHAQNIMPVIKKWLYSDKDIFLRELVSNGCDAISKYKTLARSGDATERENYRVDVVVDKPAGTLTISDNGIGMTAEEIKKYICQVAFSGAEEFLKQYKPDQGENGGIIGHFGLGFYSAFMVSKKVVIETLSCQAGAEAAKWTSEDGMEYELEPSGRTEPGTSVILYINEDDSEFLDKWTVRSTLEKYCAFMPTEIYLSENVPEAPKAEKPEEEKADQPEAEDGDKKEEEAPRKEEPVLVNDTQPLWMKKPSDCTDEEYKSFYTRVFHEYDEPLFWIHLNAEFPFNLKGILYFPRLKNEFSANEGVIKLFNNQVFVADNIKEVIPEFLMLLKGVIDCPDLPLNVSRSFLQNDGYVRKMSDYITRKVADRLVSEFNTRRSEYQGYWKDIHPFVKYGCIKDEKFYERVKDAVIFRTTADEYLTAKEYKTKNVDEGKDFVMYYTSDEKRQAQMIEMFTSQGIDVAVMDTLIDNNFMSFMEYSGKDDKIQFRRVDAGVDGLTDDVKADEEQEKKLKEIFQTALDDKDLDVKLVSLKSDELPAMITVEEQSRRFTEMSRQWGGGMTLPEKRTLTLNLKHPLVAYLNGDSADEETRKLVCEQIVDLAEMARQPLVAERMVAFLRRSNQILCKAVENK
ncbi:MAG: molecular chaperone HtpG [Clostridia bacterium]|nr:molecular chaperone HtpG [Clostridia bacterium]